MVLEVYVTTALTTGPLPFGANAHDLATREISDDPTLNPICTSIACSYLKLSISVE